MTYRKDDGWNNNIQDQVSRPSFENDVMRDIFVSIREASVFQDMPPAASLEHFPLSIDIVSRQVERLAASVEVISDIEVFGLNQKRVSRPASDLY